jgi:hypothetical protein
MVDACTLRVTELLENGIVVVEVREGFLFWFFGCCHSEG